MLAANDLHDPVVEQLLPCDAPQLRATIALAAVLLSHLTGDDGARQALLGVSRALRTSSGKRRYASLSCGKKAQDLAQEIAGRHGVSLATIRSGNRRPEIVRARWAVMSALWETNLYSSPTIGALLICHHTSVLHGVRRHAEIMGAAK
jgi:hypothetical protein